MHETIHPDTLSDGSMPASFERARAPGTSTSPAGDQAPPAAVGLLNHAVQGAHDTIDRLGDRAAPAMQQVGERVAAAEDALHEKADQLRATRDAWIDSARSTVREQPLTTLAAALAVGAVAASLLRMKRGST